MRKTIFLLSIFSSILLSQNLNEGLIVHYPLDGDAIDYSNNNIHGEVIGAEPTSDRKGKPSSAYFFDGIDDAIDLSNNSLLKPYPPFTVTGWYYYYDTPAPFFTNDFHATNYYGIFLVTAGTNRTQISYNDGGIIGPDSRTNTYTTVPQPGEWFHFTATIDENYESRIFVNGLEVSTHTIGNGSGLVYSNGHGFLGKFDASVYGPPYYLHGKIDDFRMYNRILTSQEIRILADNPNPVSTYYLTIDNVNVDQNFSEVSVPVYLEVPENLSLQSFEIDIEDFTFDATFTGINISDSDILNNNWETSVNSTFNGISIAGATSTVGMTTPSGLLFNLEFQIPEPVLENKNIPLVITKAIMNDNSTPVVTNDGSITVIANAVNYGDVDLDGQVRALDASYILQYLIGQYELTEPQFEAADVTLDSTVSGLDAQIILDYLTGKIEGLPYIPDSSMINFDGNFYMEDVIADENEQIDLPIFLNTTSNVYSIEGSIDYDSDKFDLVQLKLAKSYSNFTLDYTVEQNVIHFAAFGETVPDGDSLLTIKLRNKEYIENSSILLDRVRVNENENQFNVAASNINIITGVDDGLSLDYSLGQNYPNPFNPSTIITFTLPQAADVSIEVFDVLGRKISTLVDGFLAQGSHEVEFISDDINSGLYFYKITSGKFTDTKKMMVLK